MGSAPAISFWPQMSGKRWMLLCAILAAAFVARSVRLNELPGGFLVFNEGFYIDVGARMARQSVFSWFLNPIDVNNPPLYPLLVSWLYRLGAPLVAGARIVSVIAGTWSVFMTFQLGRLLYDESAGFIAATLLAFMPGVVLVDHNIQVDALFVALLLTGVCLYVLAVRTDRDGMGLLGGVFLGLALLTKQAAIVALPALALWEVWSSHGWRWATKERVWKSLLGFVLVGAPWYLAQFATGSMDSMLANAARVGMGTSAALGYGYDFWVAAFGRELLWMLFPLAGALALLGLFRAAVERSPGDKLVIIVGASFLTWYVFFHLHSYYLLPAAPFAALAASRALDAPVLRSHPPMKVAIVGFLVASMALGSILMMAGNKWGQWSPMALQPPTQAAGAVVLVVDDRVSGVLGPAMKLVHPRYAVQAKSLQQYLDWASGSPEASLFLSVGIWDSDKVPVKPREVLEQTRFSPVLFGFAFSQDAPNRQATQLFGRSPWSVRRIGPLWRFGLDRTIRPTGWYLYDPTSFGL